MLHPSSTYRIQFNKNFTFKNLDQIIDYLEALGISTIYASPIFKAMNGSDHGYDVVNPHIINDEIGTIDELRTLSKKLKEKGFSWIQDIVPNHMSVIDTNYRLWDVLERGRTSGYGNYFDIDWDHPQLRDRVMLPFLEANLQNCIRENKVRLRFAENGFEICYYENHYPVKPDSYDLLLSKCDLLREAYEDDLQKYLASKNADYQSWQKIKKQFVEKLSKSKNKIEDGVNRINENNELLLQLANDQYYKLEWYGEADRIMNYRRFFTVNSLICVRIEEEQVFNDYHQLIKQLYDEGLIQGLRIDHIDGLKDPAEYIRRLKKLLGKDCYIIVEKILEIKEQLPESFDLEGTSGYEFLSYINQVLTDMNGAEKLLTFYHQHAPDFQNYYDIVFDRKFSFLEKYMHGEWDNLFRLLLSLNIIENKSIKQEELHQALGTFMAAFPVYRVYIDQFPVDDISREIVNKAFEDAENRAGHLKAAFQLLKKLFNDGGDKQTKRLQFIQRLMQFTGPLAAKGVEDTTFYLYNPLISHNEVGDLPCVLGIPVSGFHEKMQQRHRANPLSLNSTSTHDTKRGEDARARINVLSELTNEWVALVTRWQQINAAFKKRVKDVMAPVFNDEYFLYQSIVGGFPEDLNTSNESKDRLKWFYTKALRESKFFSTPSRPDDDYEKACMEFIDALFDPSHAFLSGMVPFVRKVKSYAEIYSLSQVVIKSTAPGIPDFYQGSELWDLSYVDPDNRRQVNYDLRKSLMNELLQNEKQSLEDVLCWSQNKLLVGGQKMFTTRTILQYRKANNELFIEGDYIPLEIEEGKRKVIAYARRKDDKWVLIVIPTGLVAVQKTGWEGINIIIPTGTPKHWRNIFTGETITTNGELQLKEIFNQFPVAVFENYH
ncbi:malto-oligosyltrehalose synthase [Pinibacter sp. MAH-24]|uniref:Malto-oligosyltrehalose synthase n=2 Tax=Pinibacter soli TaxID=3044211 RepID=A0ABT6RIM9_9BACT|nr:malto-oligosyltrehalose synthase [Pinibacter soli]